jgi:hypothetical protein
LGESSVSLSLKKARRGELPPVREGLIAFYPFDGNAEDASGHGNHGEVKGAVSVADRFKQKNGAYEFDGKGTTIIVKDSPSFAGSGQLTIATWVKDAADGMIYCHGGQCSTAARPYRAEALFFSVRNKKAFFQTFGCRAGPVAPANHVNGRNDIPQDGSWHHLVATFDKGEMKSYLDGKLNSSDTVYLPDANMRDNPLRTSGFTSICDSTDVVRIGFTVDYCKRPVEGEPVHFFKGTIDELAIYGRALSEKEIKALAGL